MKRLLLLTVCILTASAVWAAEGPKTPPEAPRPPVPESAASALGAPGGEYCPEGPAGEPRWKIIRKHRVKPGVIPPGAIDEPRFAVMPLLAMAIPFMFILAIAAVIIVSIVVTHRARALRYRAIELAIKEGKDLPPNLLANGHGHRDPLGGGLTLTATGLGLSIALAVSAGIEHAAWGLIPLFIGIAMLISIPLRRRLNRDDSSR